jgi:hypothetical protein
VCQRSHSSQRCLRIAIFAPNATLQVFVRLWSKTLVLATRPDASIMSIKEAICDREAVPPHVFRLSYARRELDEEKTVGRSGMLKVAQ